MKSIIKRILTVICSFFAFRGVKHGKNCLCHFPCSFTSKTVLGDNCHFNGMKISGSGRVVIGDNFHSGKNIRILTSFHNWQPVTRCRTITPLFIRMLSLVTMFGSESML